MTDQLKKTNPVSLQVTKPVPGPMRSVTVRAVALACGLMPLLTLWVINNELIRSSSHSTVISLFYHVTVPLFFLSLLNLLIRAKKPEWALSGGELMTIYVMLSVAGTLCSHDMLQILVPMLIYPLYAANPQNRWEETILPHLPDWAVITNRQVANDMAVGNASMWSWEVLLAWAKPLAFWGSFLFVLMMALLLLNILFRKQWTEQEKLSFPVIQIPLIIANNLHELLRNRLFWIAFALAALIDLLNGVNFFLPQVPAIAVRDVFMLKDYLFERPWDAIADTTINLYPFVIGLSFFLPTDLAFSCWFFFVLYKLELVIASGIGIQDLPGFPFTNEQAGGSYLGIGLLAIYLSRHHLRGVWATIIGSPHGLDDSQEPLRYRTAAIALVLCSIILVMMGRALGADWWVMVIFFAIFFVYSLAITRMRAELGPPVHDLHHMGPDMLLFNAMGNRALGDGNLTAFTSLFWFNRAYRAHFSAHSMEGFKSAQLQKTTGRSMLVAMVIAIVFGTMVAFWAIIQRFYVMGFSGCHGEWFGMEPWNRLAGWQGLPVRPNLPACLATIGGLGITLLLGTLRMKFTWWLWHPVGYATCSSWSMNQLWACIFVAWVAKSIITRYGGAQAYRKSIPFFVGLVLGEFCVGTFWSLVGGIAGIPVYDFFN